LDCARVSRSRHELTPIGEDELDRLQVEHLTYLRELMRRGTLIANGPLIEQTDERLRGISIYGVPLGEALELAKRGSTLSYPSHGSDGARTESDGAATTPIRPPDRC